MTEEIVNPGALEPLFGPSDFPNAHRARSASPGAPAEVIVGRRPSPITVTQYLRLEVSDWRDACYAGASDTSIELLNYWFHSDHRVMTSIGEEFPFNYYFCQREAIETLIYLHEVRGIRTQSALTANFGGANRATDALGISPEEDRWAKYAFKNCNRRWQDKGHEPRNRMELLPRAAGKRLTNGAAFSW